MDPTFRASLRAFLASQDVADAIGDEAAVGRVLELIPPTPLKPHVVHTKGKTHEDHKPYDREDERGRMTQITGRSYVGPTECPDCTRGLASRGDRGMICMALPRTTEEIACHTGCVVACGQEG